MIRYTRGIVFCHNIQIITTNCGDDINEEYERRKREESKATTKLYENTEYQIPNGGVKGQKEVKQLFSY